MTQKTPQEKNEILGVFKASDRLKIMLKLNFSNERFSYQSRPQKGNYTHPLLS